MDAALVSTWPLLAVVGLFLVAGAVIATAGTRLTHLADRLADATGMGEALFGAVLLGGMTSLPGIIASMVSAYEGFPELAVSNALGGIAVQTAFLALADLAYRRANLEHAAASVENLVQATLLITLLSLPLLARSSPDMQVLGIHPMSLVLVIGYAAGLRLVSDTRTTALWKALRTDETRPDVPDPEDASLQRPTLLWMQFALVGLLVAAAGWAVAESGIALTRRTGLSETVVGALFTAVVTSLPELVTSIAAVRRGALTLAVGGIIGGNCFDVLFLSFSDVAYRSGSIYHAITDRQVFLVALTQALVGILLLGLLRREKGGVLGIGFESFLILVVYLGSIVVLLLQS